MAVLAPDGTVTRMLPGSAHELGARDATGRHFSVLFERDDRDAGLPDLLLRAAVAFGRSGAKGWRTRTDGSRYWWEVEVRSAGSGRGPTAGFVVLVADRLAGPSRPPRSGVAGTAGSGLADLLFNRLFAVGVTLRRVAVAAVPHVMVDRVEAAIEEIDAVISDVLAHG